jgi:hypothetical protein
MEVGYSISHPDDFQTKSLEVHLRAGRKRTIWDMGRRHPEFPYSRPCDPLVFTDVLLRQEPEEEEDEDEEDDDKDDDKDDDEEEEDDDGYSACPCLLHEGQFDGHLVT